MERIGRYVKINIESFYGGTAGGGLLYFEVDSDPGTITIRNMIIV